MLNEIKKNSSMTKTENGGAAYITTGSDCLDFFSVCGALRDADDKTVVKKFVRAYAEDPDRAMKILFYARDIRGGLGERRLFRVLLGYLAKTHPTSVNKNIQYIPEYGRYDDLLVLLGTRCEDGLGKLLKKQIQKDLDALYGGKSVSLLAKWLPSPNTSSLLTREQAARIRVLLGMREKEYRKTLSSLRRAVGIVETDLCEKSCPADYGTIPGRAMFKYRRAFWRLDRENYEAYIASVSRKEKKLHAAALYPYDVVRAVFRLLNEERFADFYRDCSPLREIDNRLEMLGVLAEKNPGRDYSAEIKANIYEQNIYKNRLSRFTESHSLESEAASLDAMWDSLPDYTDGRNAIAVVDGSGSMYWDYGGYSDSLRPIDVAMSLGIYFAERNRGKFAGHFITFSHRPRLVEVKGRTIADKVAYCSSFNEVAETNIYDVFMLILLTAVKNSVPQSELPEVIYIISDMEFDKGIDPDRTAFEDAGEKFADYGYRLPEVVYWNVSSRNEQYPLTMNESGAALVSGASPKLFELVLSGKVNPLAVMDSVIGTERYAKIKA